MSESIKARLRALENLVKDSGATAEERATASKFLDKFAVNYPDLWAEVQDETSVKTVNREVNWSKNYERQLAARLAFMCGVNPYTVSRHIRGRRKTEKKIFFEGPEPLVNMAVWMYEDLVHRLREALKGFAFGWVEGAVPLLDNRDDETKEMTEGRKKGRGGFTISREAEKTLGLGHRAGAANQVTAPHEALPSGSLKLKE